MSTNVILCTDALVSALVMVTPGDLFPWWGFQEVSIYPQGKWESRLVHVHCSSAPLCAALQLLSLRAWRQFARPNAKRVSRPPLSW